MIFVPYVGSGIVAVICLIIFLFIGTGSFRRFMALLLWTSASAVGVVFCMVANNNILAILCAISAVISFCVMMGLVVVAALRDGPPFPPDPPKRPTSAYEPLDWSKLIPWTPSSATTWPFLIFLIILALFVVVSAIWYLLK